MKKLLCAMTSILLIGAMAVSLTACGGSKVKVIDIELSTEQYGIAIAKGDTETKEAVDAILEKLTGDGVTVGNETVTFESLYQAEMEATEPISIGAVKTSSTNRANELVVATNAEFAPFEYMVGDSFGGIDMQIAKILAQEMGKELVVLHMAFEAVTIAVGESADIAIAGLTINEERMETVDFSIPYYDTTQCIAVLADNTDFDDCKTEEDVVNVLKSLSGVTAGAAKAQTGYFYLIGNESFEFDGFTNFETKQYNTVALAVQDLSNGKIQIVCGDKDTLTAAVNAINK